MPTYEYECGSCGHRFERFQRMTEKPLRKCPDCGKPVRRLIGAGAAILMKGGSSRGGGNSCSLESTGSTCCGRDQRCGTPPCGGGG
jgi:putative FmdB family regulatory protein